MVDDKSICDSCCAFTAISSKSVSGRLRFHAITWNKNNLPVLETNEQIKNRLTKIGFSDIMVNNMLGKDLFEVSYK